MCAALRDSASAVLWRKNGAGELEVFWAQRDARLSFAGGFYAFPGGRVDDADASAPVLGADVPGVAGLAHALLAACARELFEETGVLVARGPGGDHASVPDVERRELRRLLTERSPKSGERPHLFAEMLRARSLVVDAADFAYAGRWVTPPFNPVRFDARFYVVEAPPGETAEVWEGELTHGEWIRPADALAAWEQGRALLHPPAKHVLIVMNEDGPTAAGLERLRHPPGVDADHVAQRIDFQAGLLFVPLRTPTLPPWTHTNALVLGDDDLVLVDPGSPYPEEQAFLSGALRELRKQGRRLTEVVLTHWHHDHVAGAVAIAREAGATIAAHRETASRVDFKIDRLVEDGETWKLGRHSWRALHTPGHTSGHLCLLDEATGALVAGDTVAGSGTVVVDPPDGDMAEYMRTLERLAALDVRTIYPAHGPAVPDGPAKLAEYLTHRRARESQIVAALSAHAGALPQDLVPAVYTDVPEATFPLAARSVLAILLKLVTEGRARRDGERFSLLN